MTDQLFGGPWTERKLSVVRRYLERYAQALKNQAFERIYIDAFAGSGGRTDKRRLALLFSIFPNLRPWPWGAHASPLRLSPHFIHTFSSSAWWAARASCRHSSRNSLLAILRSSMLMQTMQLGRPVQERIGGRHVALRFLILTVFKCLGTLLSRYRGHAPSMRGFCFPPEWG